MGGEDSHKTYLIKTYIQSINRTPTNPFFLKKEGEPETQFKNRQKTWTGILQKRIIRTVRNHIYQFRLQEAYAKME